MLFYPFLTLRDQSRFNGQLQSKSRQLACTLAIEQAIGDRKLLATPFACTRQRLLKLFVVLADQEAYNLIFGIWLSPWPTLRANFTEHTQLFRFQNPVTPGRSLLFQLLTADSLPFCRCQCHRYSSLQSNGKTSLKNRSFVHFPSSDLTLIFTTYNQCGY